MRTAALLLATILGACGATEDSSSADAGIDAGTVVTCDSEAGVTPWSSSLAFASADGSVRVTLVAATPAAPVQGDNAWKVRIQDAAGNDLVGAAVTVAADMPKHGHPAFKTPIATRNDDGTWDISPLAFSMIGLWRVTVSVTPAGGTKKDAVVTLCLT